MWQIVKVLLLLTVFLFKNVTHAFDIVTILVIYY